jgi:uncharacterized membrane protein YpjA
LFDRRILWALLIVNGLGTIYGYFWYGNQIVYTIREMSPWLLPFVPDSPTASLFFTLALIYLLVYGEDRGGGRLRGIIEALAVVTSVKYGVWAVWMIVMGYMQGDTAQWQEYMLMISHLGMAAEALLYARFFTYRWPALAAAAVWTLVNDALDYGIGIYPWLPDELHDDLAWIARFTAALSLISLTAAWAGRNFFRDKRV